MKSESELELIIVVVDVIGAAQSTEPSAQLRSWIRVGVEVESLKSHREMGAVWRSCSLLMYVVGGWLIIRSFVISFIMRDLRTNAGTASSHSDTYSTADTNMITFTTMMNLNVTMLVSAVL